MFESPVRQALLGLPVFLDDFEELDQLIEFRTLETQEEFFRLSRAGGTAEEAGEEG